MPPALPIEVNLPAVRAFTDHWYLAFVMYREARGEPQEGRIAVGWTLLNRAVRPAWWGHSIEEVATKRWQYSSLTDPKDPQATRVWPLSTDRAWLECWTLAKALLEGAIPNPAPGADSYYDDSIAPPAWTHGARFCRKIGRLSFYDVDHDYEGQPG